MILQPNFRPNRNELEEYIQKLIAKMQELTLENNDLREKLMMLQARLNDQ
jgi:regulator of replication initiation timing